MYACSLGCKGTWWNASVTSVPIKKVGLEPLALLHVSDQVKEPWKDDPLALQDT